MAKAFVEVVGDSASATRALNQVTLGFVETGDAAAVAAEKLAAYGKELAAATATRADTLLTQAAALNAYGATGQASAAEQLAIQEQSAKKTSQAYKLLGIQAATTQASLTKTAGTIGRGLTTYVTAPTAFIGYEAVKQALDYNQALLLIHTQAGATNAELRNMNQGVLQLVQSGQSYGQSAQAMAQGLYYVESEGERGARALTILKTAAAGAANGQTDMVDTTNALTSAMKVFKVSTQDAAKTMATIDAVVATGKMHLQDLNEAFSTRFFSTAHAIGIPLEQAGALLDVFTKQGVPATVAATNLTTTLIRMVDPAKSAGTALQQLGLSQQQLGQDLQSGGMTKALADLVAGYDRLVQTQGKAAAGQAVFAAFGGSKGGGSALQAIQGYSSYMESLGKIQQLNDPASFWKRVSETMDQPAMKIKQDVAEIGADFIKLGTALAPTVATIANGISAISGAFSHLPSISKDYIGGLVALLAIGGPLGLAVSGIGRLVKGIGDAFGMIPAKAGPAIATTDAELATLQGSAAETSAVVGRIGPYIGTSIESGVGTGVLAADAKVATLRSSLLGLGALSIAPIVIPIAIKLVNEARSHVPGGSIGRTIFDAIGIPALGGATAGNLIGDIFGGGGGGHHRHAPNVQRDEPSPRAASEEQRQAASRYRRTHPFSHDGPPITQFQLPQNLANELAKAQAGYGSIAKADEDARRYILNLIHSGRLHGKAIQQAYDELASLQTKAGAAANKQVASFRKTVDNDNLLAQARLDLANGELGAERDLLNKDRMRLQTLLAEANTSEERNIVLKQLATVTRMLHTKSDQFALSPKLQEEIAKADALAALNPSNSGPDARQIQLAKQAKAAAMKAINSHELTMQGLIAAWQIVQQENSILAQTRGAIDTYHAVSSAAIVGAVQGLTQAQAMQLRERIAQAEAHRGYAPNQAGTGGGHHHVRVDVHVKSKDSHIVSVTKRHHRQTHQRAGSRR
jgi:TP901 family phage tail tape measure protein